QAGEPLALLVGELLAGPFQSGGGNRVHAVQRVGAGSVLIVVSLYGRTVHGPDFFETGDRVRVVADDVAHADIVSRVLVGRIFEDRVQGFQIGMYVTEKSDPHGRVWEWGETFGTRRVSVERKAGDSFEGVFQHAFVWRDVELVF